MPNNEQLNLEVPPTFFPSFEDHPKNAPVVRPRTERGDRVPTTAAYSIPVAGREPLDVSKYPDLIAKIEPYFPVNAAKLMHDYADKLIPAGRDVEKAYKIAEADLANRQAEADAAEAVYEETAQKLYAEIAAVNEPYVEPRAKLVEQIETARHEAAEACGAIGVEARDDVAESEILAVPVMSREKAAEILNLPVNVPEPTLAAKALSLGGTLLVGTVSGISAGLAAGILDAKSLEFQTGKLAAAALVGVGFSAFVRYALIAIFKTAAEAKYTGRPRNEVLGKFGQAYAVLVAAVAMYTAMERQGLLKLADAHNAVAKLSNVQVESVPAYVLYVMAALITFGYVVFSAAQGYREGRDAQAPARIDALIDDQHNKDSEQRRLDPRVGDALAKVARLKNLLKQLAELDAEIARKLAPLHQQLAEAAAKRIPRPALISERNQKLIQDAIDQFQGTQLEIDTVLLDLIEKIEGREGFFKRLLYALFPRLRARKRRTFKASN